ncbi:MAG: hypothetical protein EBR00_02250 [Gammaproteobacteria bacterium]|jgi:hypothetical protein|nr:hypothetical protein [Gammaproteobacteria bacterium]
MCCANALTWVTLVLFVLAGIKVGPDVPLPWSLYYRWRVGGVLSDDSTPHTATVGLLDGLVTEDQLICGARSKSGKLPTPDRAHRADVCAISTHEGPLISALPTSDG